MYNRRRHRGRYRRAWHLPAQLCLSLLPPKRAQPQSFAQYAREGRPVEQCFSSEQPATRKTIP